MDRMIRFATHSATRIKKPLENQGVNCFTSSGLKNIILNIVVQMVIIITIFQTEKLYQLFASFVP
jgi:hypothetical protein